MKNHKSIILIVDDDETGRNLLSRLLSSHDYQIIPAENGEQALELFREHTPDLIITDLNMPVMDGFQLAEAIRQDPKSAHIPIIYISALYRDMQSKVRAMDIGGNEYLTQPVNKDELLYKVKAMLRNKNLYDDLLRSREALKESEQKYRALFDNATDAIYLIDTDSQQILDCNPKASDVTGYSTTELKTMTIADLHQPSEQDIVIKIFRKMHKAGSFSDITGINQQRKDGVLVPIEVNATTFTMGGKNFSLGIFRDITERKKAQEHLLHEKNRLLTILDTMVDGVYMVNKEFDIEYVNPVLKKEFGAMTGHKCYEYFHRKKKVCPVCKNREIFAGNLVRWEWTNTENKKVYDIIETPISGPDGSTSKLAILRDITDRKKTEDSLARSRAKFEAMINAIPDAVIFVDTERHILLTNPAVATLFGYDADKLQGRTTEMLYADRAQYKKQGKQRFYVGAAESSEPYEVMYKRRDSSEFVGETLGTPVKDAQGSTIGFIGIIRDITRRKRMEAKLREAAVTDELTGLFNRRGFMTVSGKHLDLAKRQMKKLALLYLDLDNLKLINDRLGHEEGNRALHETAALLKKTFRTSDIIGRMGGDEFGVLLTEMSDGADTAIFHLKKNMEKMNDRADRSYPLLLSVGLAYFNPASPVSIDKLLSEADAAMYEDKRARKIDAPDIPVPADAAEEKRSHQRFRAGRKWTARLNGSGSAAIKDIGHGGVCLTSSLRMEPNSIYELRLFSPAKKELTSAAMVIWSSGQKETRGENRRDRLYQNGLKFIGLNAVAKHVIGEFLDEIRREPNG